MYKKYKKDSKNKTSKVSTNIKIFSTNAAGVVTGKVESLRNEVKATKANIVTIQETHSTAKGQIMMNDGFVVFEAIRAAKNGGTRCAIHENLAPKLIEEYNNQFELLVVEFKTDNKAIRIITGCGPQENWDEHKRMPFYIALEAEIVKAEISGKSVMIEMDANAKLGPQYIPKDAHQMSGNGKILASIIERHVLSVANGSSRCTGSTTRQRVTKNRTGRSSIDFVIFSNDLNDSFKSLYIDEERKHVLTKIQRKKNGIVKKESDHNILLTEFDMTMSTRVNQRKVEVYNIKNKECQDKFRNYTSNTNMLSSIFDSNDDINILTQRFLKKLDGCIKRNFKRVRINNNKPFEQDKLYTRMRELKGKDDVKSAEELEKVMEDIADIAEAKYKLVVEELEKMKPEGGKINSQKFWKMKKEIKPQNK